MAGSQLNVRQVDGQYEAFTLVERTVKDALNNIIMNAPQINSPVESLLAGCMSMGLCYISRVSGNMETCNDSLLLVTYNHSFGLDAKKSAIRHKNAFPHSGDIGQQ